MNGEIEELRHKLESFELPAKFRERNTGGADEELLERYKNARDTYLQRKVMHAVLHQATTSYDAKTKSFAIPELPSQEEQQALRERSNQVLESVTNKATAVQRQLLELQAKYAHFQLKRDEFAHTMLEAETTTQDNSLVEDEDEDDDDFEAEAAEQEEKLIELQQRRAALEVELRTVQQHYEQAEKALLERRAEFQVLKATGANTDLATLKSEHKILQAKHDKAVEIANFYSGLRALSEELRGIRILGIQAGAEPGNVIMNVQLLHRYDIEFTLMLEHKDNLTIQSAKFLSNTLISGPPSIDDDHENPTVQIRIPSPDDLVAQSAGLRNGENLRFVLRECIARITAIEDRVQELSVLQTEAVTKIGSLIDDQEVVCSLNDAQLTVVLRLAPDCPLVPGSVYIDQLVGLGGWDPAMVEHIRATINATQYQSPVALVQAIQAEVQRLVDEEGLQLPLTPKMPLRGHEW